MNVPSPSAATLSFCDPPDAPAPSVLPLGPWTAAGLGRREVIQALDAARPRLRGQPALRWDLRELAQLDHVGAQYLWHLWGRRWPKALELLPTHRQLIERVACLTPQDLAPPQAPMGQGLLQQPLLFLGTAALYAWQHAQDFVQLLGQLVLDLKRLFTQLRDGPWRDVSGHLYQMGAKAIPITALVGFLIGVVLTYLMSLQLRQFGADAFIVNILGVSLIRELGPMLAAILVAGRSGSAITAQIGVMRVTEELDAMRVMGIPHGYRLVMPRAIALAVVMPLIALWTTLIGLLGGMLAANVSLQITAAYFMNALPGAVKVANLWLAMGKSAVFGLLIALIGCHYGLRVEPNTDSLGHGTTSSVVTAITMVILVDALFAILFKNLGV
ncbi:MAG: ABC transporter permease [Burkholderiaceae bacterium]|nr:ABC transporter permease [Burkholderiaceae bacterium]